MSPEKMWYNGDGIRAPETDEMKGKRVNFHGKLGVVVKNDAFFVWVQWDRLASARNWFSRLLSRLFRKP